MRSISVRELRSKSAEIWRRLAEEKELVIRSKGRPIAILSAASEETLEESLRTFRRARALSGLMEAQIQSVRAGRDKLSLEDINREIATVRRARKP